ncbi:hypothetical protein B7P43_G03669 [Cryptotermes secundus]|uniref:Uncharacterized protein n=1 Tax=Cryptotermes secundus TaxID=105785 RepID=A0A2J7Q3J9_9NEOP|nr:hypothetical protein B7P43_G03669 [Cryptotermes secundus]
MDRVVLGQGFPRVLRFPLPILIPSNSPKALSSVQVQYDICKPTYRGDLIWTPPHTM